MPGSTVPKSMSARAPLPSSRRFHFESSPPETFADMPQRSPHRKSNDLIPRRPVREQMHQFPVQPHGARATALRLTNDQRHRLAQVVEVLGANSAIEAKPRAPDPTYAKGPLHTGPWGQAPALTLKNLNPAFVAGDYSRSGA